jgi:hypothetical protein
MSCPTCKTMFPGSGKYCEKCGAALPQQPTSVQTAEQNPSVSAPLIQPLATQAHPAASQLPGQIALPARVIITDFNMPFVSMVGLMVKLAIAAIPALIILIVLAALISAVLGALLGGILYF